MNKSKNFRASKLKFSGVRFCPGEGAERGASSRKELQLEFKWNCSCKVYITL